MKILLSALVSWSVTGERTGEHLGMVEGVALDPSSGVLVALRVRRGFLFVRRRYLLPVDVRRWGDGVVCVADDASLVRPEDEPRLAEALARSFTWEGLPVRALSGQRLGRVDDLDLDLERGLVLRLHVAAGLLNLAPLARPCTIPVERVVEVTPAGVVVDDSTAVKQRGIGRAVRRLLSPSPARAPSDSPSLPARAR